MCCTVLFVIDKKYFLYYSELYC